MLCVFYHNKKKWKEKKCSDASLITHPYPLPYRASAAIPSTKERGMKWGHGLSIFTLVISNYSLKK